MTVSGTDRIHTALKRTHSSKCIARSPARGDRIVFRTTLLLAGLTLIFYVLNVLAMALPNGRILANLNKNVSAGLLTENYPPNGIGGQMDMWSQCIALSYGLMPDGQKLNPFLAAILIPRGPNCSKFSTYLSNLETGVFDPHIEWYYRYWGGTSIFTRFGLAVNGTEGANIISMTVLITMISFFVYAVSRKVPLIFPLTFILFYAASSDLTGLTQQPTHALSHGAIFGGGAIASFYIDRPNHAQLHAGIIAGGIFQFLDLFHNPPLAFVLFVAVVWIGAIIEYPKHSLLCRIRRGLWASVGWTIGYAVLWASHWLLAVLVLGPDKVLGNLKKEMSFGFTGITATGGGLEKRPGFWQAFEFNYTYWKNLPGVKLGLYLIVIVFMIYIFSLLFNRSQLGFIPTLIFIGLVPVAWYALMTGHSTIHYWFTYRLLAGTGSLIAAIAALSLWQTFQKVANYPAGERRT